MDDVDVVFKSLMASLNSSDTASGLAIDKIMPEISTLRQRGFTYPEINNLLTKVGFAFETDTVMVYHKEYVAKVFNRIPLE